MYDLQIRGTPRGRSYLFVHGLPADRRCWDPLVAHAPEGSHLLLVDLPDSGQADDERSTDLRILEDAVVACAGRAGDGELTLVGSGFGAHLVARLLPRLARRVSRAVLVGGYASLPERELDACLDTLAGLRCGRLTLDDLREEALDDWLGGEAEPPHEELATQLIDAVTPERAVRALQRVAASAQRPVAPWETPTVVVHGEDDGVVPVECAEELSARARHGELVTIRTASHLSCVTHADEIAEIVFAP